MGKFIVVEGMDRCGKDTLIKGLRKLIQNPRILDHHSTSPPKGVDALEWSRIYYWSILYLSRALQVLGWDVIANRCHIGETVYGPIYRQTDPEFIWEQEKDYLDLDNTWLIVVVDNGLSLMRRDDGLSNESSITEFNQVRDAFTSSFHKSAIKNKILINISDDGWPDPKTIYEKIYA